MASSDRLNYFEPYERLPAGHENQLTRALLAVLKLSPMAHVAWLRRVDESLTLADLPPATFDTQRRAVLSRPPSRRDDPEGPRVISVFLGPDVEASGGEVRESDRGQVLDAIIDYGGEVVVVVENKVAEADDWQSLRLNLGGERVRLDTDQALVSWRAVLEALIRLPERGLIAGGERLVVEDFLDYVERHFGELGPSRTLSLCRGNPYRQARRLRSVLADATDLPAELDRRSRATVELPGAAKVRYAYLHVNEEEDDVRLALYPADTLGQARALYADRPATNGLLDLWRSSWSLEPNFHLGFMQLGLAATRSDLPLEEYVALWQREIEASGAVSREDWPAYVRWLMESGVASQGFEEQFDHDFTETGRESATPRPGLILTRSWPVPEAEQLDTERRFVQEVRARFHEALEALGEKLPVSGAS